MDVEWKASLDDRFTLVVEKDGLKITDNAPKSRIRNESFWDSIIRIRVDQLKREDEIRREKEVRSPEEVMAEEESVKKEEIRSGERIKMNFYHIAISEVSEKMTKLNGKPIPKKKISFLAHVSLFQNEDYLIVEQLDGPPLYPDNVRRNNKFCTRLYAQRIGQLNLNVPVISGVVKEEEIGHLITSDIATREINKGIWINGEFITGKLLDC